MLILPAIDLIDGRTVRLTQGDYTRKTDYGLDPVDVAASFEDQGAEWLHVVDLQGAKEGRPLNLDTLERIAGATSMKIEFGGGIRDLETIQTVLDAGADRVVLGSRPARDPAFAQTVFDKFGERAVAGIDTREGRVAVGGWLETETTTGVGLARELVRMGCRRIIWTDISRDGAFTGPNIEGLREMLSATDAAIIASGGVGTLDDIRALAQLPLEGAIVGKALYEQRFTLREAIAATRSVVAE